MPFSQHFSRLSVSLLLLSTMTACVQVRPLKPELSLEVQAAGGSGSYNVSGNTNLPGNTPIVVQAIRQLKPSRTTNGQPTYAIVAQESVIAQEGKWQTSLKLLQPSEDGTPLESWQQTLPNPTAPQFEASSQLMFVATTAPIKGDLRLEGDVEGSSATLRSEVLQVSSDGQRFLKAKRDINVPPPSRPLTAKTTMGNQVVKVTPKPITSSGDPKEAKTTNAPLQPTEMLR
jgi:hypothetical protein